MTRFGGSGLCPDLSYLIPHVTSHLESQGINAEQLPLFEQATLQIPAATSTDSTEEASSSTRATRKARAFTASEWSKDHLTKKVKELSEQMLSSCDSKEDASTHLSLVSSAIFLLFLQTAAILFSSGERISEDARSMETYQSTYCACPGQSDA